MPRLFTGIELPEEVMWRLSMLRAGLSGASWIDPENYHITLRFVGDISDRDATRFADALDLTEFQSFKLAITGLDVFGGGKPRTLWAAIRPSQELLALQTAHERVARSSGFPPETRNFTPHITLARLKNIRPDVIAEYLAAYGGFAPMSFEVSRFALFSSRPNRGGGPYVIEESYWASDAYFEQDYAPSPFS